MDGQLPAVEFNCQSKDTHFSQEQVKAEDDVVVEYATDDNSIIEIVVKSELQSNSSHHSNISTSNTFAKRDKIIVTILVLLLTAVLIVSFTFSNAANVLSSMIIYVKSHLVIGCFIIFFLYFIAVIIILPIKTFLAILIGYLYGLIGILITFSAAFAGAIVAYILGKYLCRESVRKCLYSINHKLVDVLGTKRKSSKIVPANTTNVDENISDIDFQIRKQLSLSKKEYNFQILKYLFDEKPYTTMMVLILSPMPMEYVSYIASNSSIKYKPYVVTIFIGRMLSKSPIYVYVGYSAQSLESILNGDISLSTIVSLAIAGGFLLLAVILSCFLWRNAKKWVKENMNHEHDEQKDEKGE